MLAHFARYFPGLPLVSPVYGTRDHYIPAKRFWGLYQQLPRIFALERSLAMRTALRAQQLAGADDTALELELDALVRQAIPQRPVHELPPLTFERHGRTRV